MNLKSILLGVAVTAVLLAVLVATRMMEMDQAATEYEIREIETVELAEPPPPPEEEPPPEEIPPPPPPALADLSLSVDVTQPPMPSSDTPLNPRMQVDTFFTDQSPAPLPTVAKPRPKARPKPAAKPRAPRKPRVHRTPPPRKSQYSVGELDRKPRLIRNPSVTFPRSIRNASRGRVVVRVAILPNGRSRLVSIVSSTHKALNPLARRIANGSRFTPPTRQGRPVKAVMTWPIIIRK